MLFNVDFRFDEIFNLEVLELFDHGMGLESNNAQDATVSEDLKRHEVISDLS
jgi:hypothetical protein